MTCPRWWVVCAPTSLARRRRWSSPRRRGPRGCRHRGCCAPASWRCPCPWRCERWSALRGGSASRPRRPADAPRWTSQRASRSAPRRSRGRLPREWELLGEGRDASRYRKLTTVVVLRHGGGAAALSGPRGAAPRGAPMRRARSLRFPTGPATPGRLIPAGSAGPSDGDAGLPSVYRSPDVTRSRRRGDGRLPACSVMC